MFCDSFYTRNQLFNNKITFDIKKVLYGFLALNGYQETYTFPMKKYHSS